MAYAAQALQAAALVLLTYIVTSIYQSYRSSIDFQAFARANNCQPPVFSPSYLPWGLDRIYKILTSKGCDFVDDFIFARFKSQGRWTVISTAFGGSFTVRHLEIYTALRAEVLPTFGPDPSSSSSPPPPPSHRKRSNPSLTCSPSSTKPCVCTR
ncbi:MAG: hypothetical protein FRX48_06206 [Lasallia pustulata]|uniref:Cytochrome P450 n=1 Tax=Lasallia pustulata TaxID=136370 RepID=A0A5M8PKX7_9LECA|nr:MAG: hypothetical protein FRX48_06206 [Lasallia pustulata]